MRLAPLHLLYFLLMVVACRTNVVVPAAGGADWRVLVVEQGSGQVKLLDTAGRVLDSVRVGYNPHEIALDPAQRRAYVSNFGVEDYDYTIGTPGTTVSVIDVEGFSAAGLWPTYRPGAVDTSRGPHGIRLRPGHPNELYVNVEYGDSMLVYDTLGGRIVRSFPLPTGNHNFTFSPDGQTVYLQAGAGGLYRLSATTGDSTGHFATPTPVRGVAPLDRDRKLLVSCRDELFVIDTAALSVERHFSDLGVGQILYSTLSPDESLIFAPAPFDNVVLVIDAATGEVLHRLACGRAPINVQMTPDGRYALVSNAMDDHLSRIDLSDFSVAPFGRVNRPNGLVFLAR
ncbi:YncE family protein [Neolewinella litorea]|uniref:YncE family protein n=1 Tax=Neolewinella litorea TaxID=2562452 RepID=A0A4S4NAF9_9BACT|nr:YncE family protein [Neolewinella litorea]THH36304.1 YncE family protein [Neolewinella litorea]